MSSDALILLPKYSIGDVVVFDVVSVPPVLNLPAGAFFNVDGTVSGVRENPQQRLKAR